MFSRELTIPKKPKSPKRHSKCNKDILLPSTTPGHYQHIAREPNTNHHVQMLFYKQRKDAEFLMSGEDEKKRLRQDANELQNKKHSEREIFARKVRDKVQEKMREYDAITEMRKERLRDLLCKEEQEYYYETVNSAQTGHEKKIEEMKIRADAIKAAREAKRLELVNQKRIEQYRDRCEDLRPLLVQKNLVEIKRAQLQQIRENESRREEDRERERMWNHVTKKELEAKIERETQDMLREKGIRADLLNSWNTQVQGKQHLKAEMQKMANEDRLEMLKLSEALRNEEIEGLRVKCRKRDQMAIELREQIASQEKFFRARKEEEQALDNAFAFLTQQEIEREKEKQEIGAQTRMREIKMYRKHLQELEVEREKEERQLNELLDIHKQNLEEKQNEAKCKVIEAKLALQKNVLEGRAEQVKYKKQEAEEQLKLKEYENELLRMVCEMNDRLQAQQDRADAEARIQYSLDLKKQIEYNNALKKREQDIVERQLAEGLVQEEKYRKVVEDMLKGELKCYEVHPFRSALEQHDCRCPKSKQ